MLDLDSYRDREQTYIKHLVLKSYLQKLAYKKGRWGGTINYVDCFAGPWRHEDEDLRDTSPFIAVNELREAREGLGEHSCPPLHLRCLFIERNLEAWSVLKSHLEGVEDVEIDPPINGIFEEHVDSVVQFAQAARTKRSFSFFFIDPTGWTGYPLETIKPILQLQSSEVLINFMTQFVSRFIDNDRPEDIESFKRLFGSDSFRDHWAGLKDLDREDAIVEAYCDRLREVGGYRYVARTVILDPLSDRSHFHLIYGTRHIEGLRVFRNDVERPTGKKQKEVRWQARERQRTERTGQRGLFDEPIGRTHSDELRDRYQTQAHKRLWTLLERDRNVEFDKLEEEALMFPLMSTQDLKEWLVTKKDQGVLRFDGLAPRARVPQPNKNHRIVLI